MILERILGHKVWGGGLESTGWIICLAQNRGCLRDSVKTGEFLGLNEVRGICRPSKQPVVHAPRSFFLPLFAFSVTSFPSLRYCKGLCDVFVRRVVVSRLTHYILICRDIKESWRAHFQHRSPHLGDQYRILLTTSECGMKCPFVG